MCLCVREGDSGGEAEVERKAVRCILCAHMCAASAVVGANIQHLIRPKMETWKHGDDC